MNNLSRVKSCPNPVRKYALSIIGLSLTLLIVVGCASTSNVNDFCDTYKPVYVDDNVPEEYLLLIDLNNAVYMERCL